MNNTLCSAAWTDMNIDFTSRTIRHCCKSLEVPFPETLTVDFFNNSKRINQTRTDLLNGIQSPDCVRCWDDYSLTGNAYRDFKNEWCSHSDVTQKIEFIEIFLDNLCDMSCVYCDEVASSKIASEKKINNPKNPKIDEDLSVFFDFLETVAKHQDEINLSFIGGEVTYSKKFFYFVEQLLENDILLKSNVNFSILTNCNSSDAAMLKIISLFNKMPEHWYVHVSISNESTGATAELVRYGLSWDRFLRNFKMYYQHRKVDAVLIAPTLSIFTVKTFPDFIKTIIDIIIELGNTKTFKVTGNWILFPEILNPVYAKAEYKSSINDLKNFVTEVGVIRNPNFITFLEKLEHRIGSLELDHSRLYDFLEELAEQKSDNNIWKLKDLL
jgi:MoaA/NifB/PqqE/SkfB family radical SAM enzyme